MERERTVIYQLLHDAILEGLVQVVMWTVIVTIDIDIEVDIGKKAHGVRIGGLGTIGHGDLGIKGVVDSGSVGEERGRRI